MPDVTITFKDGTVLPIGDAPEGTTDLQVAEKVRSKYPDKVIASINGVEPAPLMDRLKAFATQGQKQVFGKDLPQLALGAADTLSLGSTSDLQEPQTPDEKKSRNMGRTLPAAVGTALPTKIQASIGGMDLPWNTGTSLLRPPNFSGGSWTQGATAAAARAAQQAPQAMQGINPQLLKAILRGAGIGIPGADVAYHIYDHFFR